MKLGVLTVLFQDRPLDAALDQLVKMGVQAVEIGTGAYPGNAHCNPTELLKSSNAVKAFRKNIEDRGLMISALSCHGNPLSPDPTLAAEFGSRLSRNCAACLRNGSRGCQPLFGLPG